MAALVLLCGCGRSAEMSAEDVRAHFASLDSCTAHLKIISDLDESVLEFESDYVYNREDSDSFTLTAPESVAGIGGRVRRTARSRCSTTTCSWMILLLGTPD